MELYKCKDCFDHDGITDDYKIKCMQYPKVDPYVGYDDGFRVVLFCPKEMFVQRR